MAQTTKRNRKRSAQAGVTLIEMLVVVTIIGLFVALVGPSLFKRADEAKVTVTRSQIDNFMTALGTYKLDTGTFPTTEQGLQRSEEHTSELQSLRHPVCRLLLEKTPLTTNLPKFNVILATASTPVAHRPFR